MENIKPILCITDCLACKKHIVEIIKEKIENLEGLEDSGDIWKHDFCIDCDELGEARMTKKERKQTRAREFNMTDTEFARFGQVLHQHMNEKTFCRNCPHNIARHSFVQLENGAPGYKCMTKDCTCNKYALEWRI